MRRTVPGIAAVAVASLAISGNAATLNSIEVTRNDGRYELRADTFLEAEAADIYDVLLEYEDDKFQRVSSVYKESRYLEPEPDGTQVVYTLMEGCVMFFCMKMHRTERLEKEANKYIRTETIPEESNFKYSHSEWALSPVDGGTQMVYTMVMEPDFFVPPIVGPIILKRILRSGGSRVISRIERMAQGEDMPRLGAR